MTKKMLPKNERVFKKNLLLKMQKNAGNLIADFIADASADYKIQKLQNAYNAAGGDGVVLLGKIFPKRVKFLINGKYGQASYIAPIKGAEEFIVVCDCESLKCKIMEVPIAEMLEF